MRLFIGILLIVLVFILPLLHKTEPEPQPQPTPNPIEPELQLHTLPIIRNNVSENSLYAEVINRTTQPYLSRKEFRSTQAHETTHQIHAELRNGNGGLRAFYITPDKYYLVRDAKFKKADIVFYVPEDLRYSRFFDYIVGAPSWNNSPLYTFDEWCSYINGAEVAVDDAKNTKKESENFDTVMGSLEFSIYAVATCMAIADKDEELWSDTSFRQFVKLNIKRAQKVFMEGKDIFPFPNQDKMLQKLRESPQAQSMRDFINEHLDGVFLND